MLFSVFNVKKLYTSNYFIINSFFKVNLTTVTSHLNYFILQRLFFLCPKFILYGLVNEQTNQLFIKVASPYIISFFTFLSSFFEFSYNSLTDICAIDFPERSFRFSLLYNLISVKLNHRIFISFDLPENGAIFSITSIFRSANCLEREVWDLFGIFFLKHPDLRRILTDYGFDGFALRKDFPLTGYVEVRFEESLKVILYEPLELSQEYRFFDFQTPWKVIY